MLGVCNACGLACTLLPWYRRVRTDHPLLQPDSPACIDVDLFPKFVQARCASHCLRELSFQHIQLGNVDHCRIITVEVKDLQFSTRLLPKVPLRCRCFTAAESVRACMPLYQRSIKMHHSNIREQSKIHKVPYIYNKRGQDSADVLVSCQ